MLTVRGLRSGPIAVFAWSSVEKTEEDRGLGFTLRCEGLTLKEFYSLQNSLDDLSDRMPMRRNPAPVIFEPTTLHSIFVHVVDATAKVAATAIATQILAHVLATPVSRKNLTLFDSAKKVMKRWTIAVKPKPK